MQRRRQSIILVRQLAARGQGRDDAARRRLNGDSASVQGRPVQGAGEGEIRVLNRDRTAVDVELPGPGMAGETSVLAGTRSAPSSAAPSSVSGASRVASGARTGAAFASAFGVTRRMRDDMRGLAASGQVEWTGEFGLLPGQGQENIHLPVHAATGTTGQVDIGPLGIPGQVEQPVLHDDGGAMDGHRGQLAQAPPARLQVRAGGGADGQQTRKPAMARRVLIGAKSKAHRSRPPRGSARCADPPG